MVCKTDQILKLKCPCMNYDNWCWTVVGLEKKCRSCCSDKISSNVHTFGGDYYKKAEKKKLCIMIHIF